MYGNEFEVFVPLMRTELMTNKQV